MKNRSSAQQQEYVTLHITDENFEQLSEVFNRVNEVYKVLLDKKDTLEDIVPDDAERGRTILPEDEDICTAAFEVIVEFEARLKQAARAIEDTQRKEQDERQRRQAEERRQAEVRQFDLRQKEIDLQMKEFDTNVRTRELEVKETELRCQVSVEELKAKVQLASTSADNSRSGSLGHLPKVSLMRFGRNALEFNEFWDNFSSLVDSRSDLDDIQKFHYLKGQLFGKAADKVSGIRVCGDNYKIVVDLLREEFGSSQLIITKLYDEIRTLRPTSQKPCDIHQFYSDLEIKLRLIENQGSNLDQDILKLTIFSKLAVDTQKELVKLYGSSVNVGHIRSQINKGLSEARVLRTFIPHNSELRKLSNLTPDPFQNLSSGTSGRLYTNKLLINNTNIPDTNNPDNRTYSYLCTYCDGSHYSDSCTKYSNLTDRSKERVYCATWRSGGCSALLSDNAQQFKLLKKAVETIYSLNEFQDLLNDNKIEFKFTSPLSSWAGGTFERLISITKQCLRKSIGRILVSRKQLETLMVEIEYVVNSRPLGYYANEDLIITPNHFLCLKKDSLLPAGLPSNVTLPGSVTFKNLIALWKKGNKYLNIFWSAWYSQYLMSLRERNNVGTF
ncbi:hypothetical protein M8J77_001983 [Diaphorina citri]|nr:hypothetical protein M8J77_001983 [Diaphorina citri]